MDDVLSLVTATTQKDIYGVSKPSYTKRQVFCRVLDVTRAEFFAAGRNGLNPQYKFMMFAGDYDGEQTCEYNGHTYAIYRTFHVPGTDIMELYVERKGGTNGITEESASEPA